MPWPRYRTIGKKLTRVSLEVSLVFVPGWKDWRTLAWAMGIMYQREHDPSELTRLACLLYPCTDLFSTLRSPFYDSRRYAQLSSPKETFLRLISILVRITPRKTLAPCRIFFREQFRQTFIASSCFFTWKNAKVDMFWTCLVDSKDH